MNVLHTAVVVGGAPESLGARLRRVARRFAGL